MISLETITSLYHHHCTGHRTARDQIQLWMSRLARGTTLRDDWWSSVQHYKVVLDLSHSNSNALLPRIIRIIIIEQPMYLLVHARHDRTSFEVWVVGNNHSHDVLRLNTTARLFFLGCLGCLILYFAFFRRCFDNGWGVVAHNAKDLRCFRT